MIAIPFRLSLVFVAVMACSVESPDTCEGDSSSRSCFERPRPPQKNCQTNVITCTDESLWVCDAGEPLHVKACEFGCNVGGDDCAAPPHEPWPTLSFVGDVIIDTDRGIVFHENGETPLLGKVVDRPGGVPVFHAWASDAYFEDVTLYGQAGLAFTTRDDFVVRGHFDVSSAGQATPEICGPAWTTDGHGGGFGAPGGVNGDSPRPRRPSGNEIVEPLRGGCGDGAGGALRVRAGRAIRIESGYIDAGGSGGLSYEQGLIGRANGGASGGAVVLEAPEIFFEEGTGVSANGGGGGCRPLSLPNGGLLARPGQDGGFTTDASAGGCPLAGAGGTIKQPQGRDTIKWGNQGQAAGGGVGRIVVRTSAGGLHKAGEVLLTPAPYIALIKGTASSS